MNDIVDMSQFVEAKSDQLNADDLLGAPRTITICRVTGCEGDQPIAIYYEGDNNKPFKPCKTIRRVLLAVWGRYAQDYVGRSMTIYRDDGVTFGGLQVGGIRISHMSHIDKEMTVVVMKTKGKKAGVVVKPLETPPAKRGNGKQTADEWADEQIGAVTIAASLDSLATLIDRGAKAMAKLEISRRELWEKVNAAYAARRAELEPEGRADSDMGEGFADADPIEGF